MKLERMLIKIAEACGYVQCDRWPRYYKVHSSDSYVTIKDIPNYTESIDAMAEARETLNSTERKKYAEWLWDSVDFEFEAWIDITPLQHAEAFIRANGLWEEGE